MLFFFNLWFLPTRTMRCSERFDGKEVGFQGGVFRGRHCYAECFL